jgi:hypothetical protein
VDQIPGASEAPQALLRGSVILGTSVWDILVEGKRIKFRDKPRSIVLEIKTEPPNVFHILRMDMSIYGFRIISDKNRIKVVSPDGSLMSIGGISGSNLNTVIALHSR